MSVLRYAADISASILIRSICSTVYTPNVLQYHDRTRLWTTQHVVHHRALIIAVAPPWSNSS